ncbi:unnamed protein product [Enterobius vermicularis]|uniref:Activin_recp domain-containing protein n=1 Tax=Enterobius vermicularis TaxID=51028 RepID=A0A0N4VNQ1_ENTVE|nr:unnamed protein product [Enterobius vermicularis]
MNFYANWWLGYAVLLQATFVFPQDYLMDLKYDLGKDFEPAKCNGTKEDCTKLVKCRYTSNDKIPACVYILAHEVNKSAKVPGHILQGCFNVDERLKEMCSQNECRTSKSADSPKESYYCCCNTSRCNKVISFTA